MLGLDPELVVHMLNVDLEAKPVAQPARVFHTDIEEQIIKEVKKLLAVGFIRPIQHPRWLSNIVQVKKKNGQIRCCIDFRNLNRVCPKDEFPLPNLNLLIDSAAGNAMISFMDGFSEYNKIRMAPKDMEKTAFKTPRGNFYYTMMHFRLKNAGVTYQRTMTAIHDMMHRELEDFWRQSLRPSPSYSRRDKASSGKRSSKRPFTADYDEPSYGASPNPQKATIGKRPLLLYLATSSYAIGKLIAQEDGSGVEQPVYYISRTLKDAETRYPRAKRACLAIVYASQRLCHYFLAYEVWLITKSHVIKALLWQPILSGKYKAYLTELSTTLEMGVKHLKVIGDSNLVVCQTKGIFSLKEPNLASYRTMTQKMEEKFSTFEIKHTLRSENRYADALAALGLQIAFEGSNTRIEVTSGRSPLLNC
ncbi:uncharacterized protein LOC142639974 [Castanea sativa]|uniref:uncharacterized protein LOC142639974 n=1 Tax=Castanea sativa TaxID=21020 RepID=UPI003F6535E2